MGRRGGDPEDVVDLRERGTGGRMVGVVLEEAARLGGVEGPRAGRTWSRHGYGGATRCHWYYQNHCHHHGHCRYNCHCLHSVSPSPPISSLPSPPSTSEPPRETSSENPPPPPPPPSSLLTPPSFLLPSPSVCPSFFRPPIVPHARTLCIAYFCCSGYC